MAVRLHRSWVTTLGVRGSDEHFYWCDRQQGIPEQVCTLQRAWKSANTVAVPTSAYNSRITL